MQVYTALAQRERERVRVRVKVGDQNGEERKRVSERGCGATSRATAALSATTAALCGARARVLAPYTPAAWPETVWVVWVGGLWCFVVGVHPIQAVDVCAGMFE